MGWLTNTRGTCSLRYELCSITPPCTREKNGIGEPRHGHWLTDSDWTPTGVENFIMLAGSAGEVTEFDGWMFRNWWYELSRDRGWQS